MKNTTNYTTTQCRPVVVVSVGVGVGLVVVVVVQDTLVVVAINGVFKRTTNKNKQTKTNMLLHVS